MQPGRKFDVWVAENVMGWPVFEYSHAGDFPHITDDDLKGAILLWRMPDQDAVEWSPSTDDRAAAEVIAELVKRGHLVETIHAKSGVAVYIDRAGGSFKTYQAAALTLPHAVCLAARKLIEAKT